MTIGTAIAVVFAVNVTAGPVQLAEGTPTASRSVPTASNRSFQVTPTEIGFDGEHQHPGAIPDVLIAALWLMFYTLLVLVTLLAVRFLWRHRASIKWPERRRVPTAFDVLEDSVAASVVADAAGQRAALQRGVPRNAIVECWRRLELAVADAGVIASPSDTSLEFTERVLSDRQVDSAALGTLAGLYREARFSDHAMSESARESAIDALAELHASLAAGVRDSVSSA